MNSLADHSDEARVRSCQTAIQPAPFNELTRRYRSRVVHWCHGYLRDADDAQDVTQEVFIRLLTRLPTYRHEVSFVAWLKTIVRNRCVDHLRQDKHALDQELSENIAAPWEEELDTEEVSVPTEALVYQLLNKLKGGDKYLLLLCYREGYSTKQLAEALLVSETVVRKRLQRARDRMQVLLKKHRNSPERPFK
ncbi:MAG: sigma-70 family RNA polymerase sigma factor [Tunicatimonas sp.]